MELSSILEADIQGIQNQLKTAILNHQIGMMKLRKDPENVEAKKQIADAQNAIISLSTSQKFILQKLRNDMLVNGLTKSSCGNDSSNKRPNPIITVNGSTTPALVGISSAHGHMGHHHNHQHVQPVRHRAPGVSIGTETIGLAAIGRENQPPKANGNFAPAALNLAADALPLGGKLAHEGPPYLHRPHPTPPPPPPPSIASRQCSHSPVDCSSKQLDARPRVTCRSSISPYSSGGEDLDADEDDDEDEEEVPRPNVYDGEDDMDGLRYSSEDEKKDVLAKKDEVSPCKYEAPAHPSDDHDIDSKLKFFAALGLVTRETCSEMQSRRGERKRRSTANPQFVYGNWDLSKRKKNGYLLTSSSPLQLRKRGRPRLDGSSELALFPTSFLPLPKSLSNIPYSSPKDVNSLGSVDHFNENHHQFGLSHGHQMLGHALGGALKPSQHYYAPESLGSGHHTKKPLEHINGNISTIRKFCVVCKNISGPLVLCEECDVRYHPFCGKPIDGKRHCPKCETHSSAGGGSGVGSRVSKEETSTGIVACRETTVISASPSSTVTCSAQVTATSSALHSLAAERAAKVEEKRRLLLRNQELNAEKAKLEQRVSELTADLSAQAARKRDLLSAEEKTRRSIKKVHDFIRNIQQGFKRSENDEMAYMAPMAPCSIVTSTSEGVQAS
ncbi:PHD finger protein 21A-like isoform X2 [Hetaerina americana]|uniref:PHD finger protein 21A-like isoform X2 n=1 Tax=Hetaerina americana TaxID=62018 RepID=UPI003A7F24CF